MTRESYDGLFACPCCGYATLKRSGRHEICAICFWEDDGHDDPEADINWGGPNYVSLTEGRKNFLKLGVSDPKDIAHVRAPSVKDVRLRNYQLDEEEKIIFTWERTVRNKDVK